MERGALQKLIEEFTAKGGAIARMPETAVSVDWSDGRFRAAARTASQFGHVKRWQKAA